MYYKGKIDIISISNMGYTRNAIKGISWMTLLRVSTRGITFLRLAILARILTPAQFGVFGVATIVLSFLEVLTETGINIFLIQKKDETYKYINSAWVVSILRGFLIAFILIFSAPLIITFFNSPNSYSVLVLIATVPIIRGFINPSIINIQKEIQFEKEFYLRSILLTIDAAVVVIVAFITKSTESFAYGLIASAIVEVLLSFIFFKPWPKISLEISKVSHIIKRGWWITVTWIFVYLAENIDNIVVGRFLGVSPLGIYQNAYKISTLSISEINEVVNKVTFPVYSKFSQDKERLFRAFLRVVSTSSVVAFILGLFIFVFAEQLVIIILGPNWIQAAPVIKILAFYGVLRTTFGNFSAMFLSIEKQNYVAVMTLVRLMTLLAIIVPFTVSYGMVGSGYAMLISIFAEIPIMLYFVYRVFKKE